jgi:hypothetical protein
MKDSEILEKCADDVSRPGGWQQGSMGQYAVPDAPVCLSGALFRYMREGYDRWTEYSDPPLCQYMHFEVRADLPCDSISEWNDTPGRTAGEVADQFRTTAKRLREVGR